MKITVNGVALDASPEEEAAILAQQALDTAAAEARRQDAQVNGEALAERKRAEKKAQAISLLAQGKTEEAVKELLEII